MPVRLILLALLLPFRAWAQEGGISAAELARAPTPARVAFMVGRAAQLGWAGAVPGLHQAAVTAYEANTGTAPAWYHLYRWAALLGQPESKAIPEWIKAIDQARLGHPNMAASYTPKPGSLAAYWSQDLQAFALGSPQFSEEFFLTLNPADNPMNVLSILQQLYAADPARFAAYQNLAIALAVVYDVPPPPGWPHGQVSAQALPRQMMNPLEAFNYWTKADRENRTLHKLKWLGAGELKFVVDTGALSNEMDWAQQNITQPLADFAKVYDLVRYRKDRLQASQFMWPKASYQLPLILQDGGICVDQAYFASMAGKARGIPTLLFRGAGLDGRHAWFGYLDAQQRWQLDCGRYAEQKYVVGLAFDPQTWGNINDHELLFLSERFRALPTYKLSVTHALFAAEYLRSGRPDLALKAAREAVNRERRNLAAWQVLLQAQQALAPGDLRAREGLLHEAVQAFQKYPDLEKEFSRLLVATLRARGETSVAGVEEQRLARKYQTGRVDIGIEQAAEVMERSMHQDDLVTQLKVFDRELSTARPDAAIDFHDKVVVPFVRHLQQIGQVPAALQVLERTRRTLRVEPGMQLDKEITSLAASLKAGKSQK